MRKRFLGLTALFVMSVVVSACGGATADIKKVGLVTDVGTLEDKSFNEASWVGAQAGATAVGGKASNIVTKAPADYAANIKTFVDQGYGTIVTVGFAMGKYLWPGFGENMRVLKWITERCHGEAAAVGRRDDGSCQAVSERQVHRRRPGRLHR